MSDTATAFVRFRGPGRGTGYRRHAGQTGRPGARALGGAAALCILSTAARADSFLNPQGPVAAAQAWHFWFIIAVMAVVVVPVFVFVPVLLWRYRYGRKSAEYRPKWNFSWGWEAALWGVPILVVLVLAPVLWSQTGRLDPYRPLGGTAVPLRVEVVGYDWKWLFLYPDQGIATVGQLVLPAGRPVSIVLTSDTVMQSFFIPALGSQIYAMQGMRTRLNLRADRPGQFMGENTQYNGPGFHAQRFRVRALPAQGFADWVAAARARNRPLTPTVLAALQDDGTAKDLASGLHLGDPSQLVFSSMPAGLFGRILSDGPAADPHVLAGDRPAAPAAGAKHGGKG